MRSATRCWWAPSWAGRSPTTSANTGYFPTFGGVTSVQVPLDAPTVSLPVSFAQSATDADNHGTATIAAIYAQDQVALTSRLQAVAGLRFDAFDLDFTNNRTGQALASHDRLLSPRLGLIYKLLEPVSVYGSYSLTYIPRGGDQLSSLSLTNQSLDPEEFKNYEVGMKWEAARLGVTAAVYRLDRSNVAVPDPADPTRSILVDAQRSKGLEVDVNGSLTRNWSLVAGYAYQDGEITRALSSTVPAGADLAQVPSHSVSLWTRYNVTPRLAGGAGNDRAEPDVRGHRQPGGAARLRPRRRRGVLQRDTEAARPGERREPVRRRLFLHRPQQQQHHTRLAEGFSVCADRRFLDDRSEVLGSDAVGSRF